LNRGHMNFMTGKWRKNLGGKYLGTIIA